MKWWIALLIFFGLMVLTIPAFAGGRGVLVWPRDLEKGEWPITTSFARIYCKDLGYGKKAVYLTTTAPDKGFQDYAVNGTARGAMGILHLKDGLKILKPGFAPYKLQPFINIGLKECKK